MMVRAKAIYILMIKVSKLLSFLAPVFSKRSRNMFSVFLSRKSSGELEKAVQTLACSCGSCSQRIFPSPKLLLVFLFKKYLRFHVVVRLFSKRPQMTSRCGKAHEEIAECVADVGCCHFSFFSSRPGKYHWRSSIMTTGLAITAVITVLAIIDILGNTLVCAIIKRNRDMR